MGRSGYELNLRAIEEILRKWWLCCNVLPQMANHEEIAVHTRGGQQVGSHVATSCEALLMRDSLAGAIG